MQLQMENMSRVSRRSDSSQGLILMFLFFNSAFNFEGISVRQLQFFKWAKCHLILCSSVGFLGIG